MTAPVTETGSASHGAVSLHYRLTPSAVADSTPMLLINGLGSPLVSYEDGFVAHLNEAGFDVVRFDNRDVGRSSRCDGHGGDLADSYQISDMATDALAVLDAVGWDRAVVVGQSMGGMIAQQLAIDHPDRVLALVSVMSASGKRGSGQATDEAMATLLTPAPFDPEGWLDHRVASERVWASPEHWDEDWVRAKGRAMLDHGIDRAGVNRQYRAIVASGTRDEGLENLDVPTLVIHGSVDPLITPDGGRHVAELVPDARYVEIEGMGHDLPPALWPRIIDEITRFAAEVVD